MTPPGMVTLDPARGASLTLILAGPPERGGGAGGWASSERAQRRPGRWWQSLPEDTMSLDCILDLTAIRGPSIERRLERLYAMAQPGDADHPPPIRLAGDIWAPDRARKWVIQNATLGERLFTPSGALRRQQLTIELEGYRDVKEIQAVRVRATRTKRGKRRRRSIRSKQNDTLRIIALRELGEARRWRDLREWNKRLRKIDPDARLRAGTKVELH